MRSTNAVASVGAVIQAGAVGTALVSLGNCAGAGTKFLSELATVFFLLEFFEDFFPAIAFGGDVEEQAVRSTDGEAAGHLASRKVLGSLFLFLKFELDGFVLVGGFQLCHVFGSHALEFGAGIIAHGDGLV